MIAPDLAVRLGRLLAAREAGWQPRSGDRFVFPDRDLDQVFVISEMTIEVAELPTGRLIRFNGTTEWALDSVSADDVIWLPWEHQLRALLGDRFVALARVPDGPAVRWAVTLDDGSRYVAEDPEDAYALAALA